MSELTDKVPTIGDSISASFSSSYFTRQDKIHVIIHEVNLNEEKVSPLSLNPREP